MRNCPGNNTINNHNDYNNHNNNNNNNNNHNNNNKIICVSLRLLFVEFCASSSGLWCVPIFFPAFSSTLRLHLQSMAVVGSMCLADKVQQKETKLCGPGGIFYYPRALTLIFSRTVSSRNNLHQTQVWEAVL